jgi:MFS family permease
VKLVLGVGSAVGAVGCFVLAGSTNYQTAMVAQVLLGLGLSGTFVGLIFLIGRDFSSNFAFMSSLSQSLTNIAGAALSMVASLTPWLADFRTTFRVMAALLLGVALLQFLLIRGRGKAEGREEAQATPFLEALRLAVGNFQFWMAMVYYAGLFGTMLAFANLWNIQFQINYFKNTPQESAMMNAMIALGITAGSLVAGTWAKKSGSFVLPARTFGLLALAVFIFMAAVPLPRLDATAMILVMGFGLSGSILGLSALYANLPAAACSVATSLVVTAAFIHGALLQTLIGSSLAASGKIAAHQGAGAHHGLFVIYEHGMIWLIGSVAASALASFFFRK